MEKLYIQVYNSTDKAIGYNLTFGGDGCVPNDETRRKISDVLKGENNPNFGKHHSDEARKKMSEAKQGENNYWYGKQRSTETKQKMSEAHKGVSPSNKGKPMKKFKWLTPNGEIVEMSIAHVKQHHHDWILLEE